jgi:hypothetical protein
MKTTLLFFFFFSLRIVSTFAQESECATDYVHSKLMLEDAAYRNQIISLEEQIAGIIQNSGARTPHAVVTLPIVVHVIHLGEPVGTGTNISDAQIQAAIAGLNSRWRNSNGLGVDFEVDFCLASRDPAGNATNGINRVDGSAVPNYPSWGIAIGGCSNGAIEDDVKILSRWPVASYYNIWVVNRICNGQWGGWSYYPYGGVNDGACVVYAYMNGSNSLLSHEVGHGFFLYHTFEGDGGNAYCPANANCATDGDHVCDTPPHKQNDCGSTDVCTGIGIWDNSRYNYMSYCSGTDRFTQGQKDRVQATLSAGPRVALLTSLGCSAPTSVAEIYGNHSFEIFPNPSNGRFSIRSNMTACRLTLMNTLGEILYCADYNSDLSEMDFSNFSKVFFFLKVQTHKKTTARQVILN